MKPKKPEDLVMPKYPKRNAPGAGRPPELTDEIITAVKNSLLVGNYFETAVACAGFHKDTGYAWLKRGAREPESIYRKFSDAVRQAEAESEARDVMLIEIHGHGARARFDENGNKIREAIPPDPKLVMWRLERKHPKKWGRTDKHELSGKVEVNSFVELIQQLEKDVKEEEDETE